LHFSVLSSPPDLHKHTQTLCAPALLFSGRWRKPNVQVLLKSRVFWRLGIAGLGWHLGNVVLCFLFLHFLKATIAKALPRWDPGAESAKIRLSNGKVSCNLVQIPKNKVILERTPSTPDDLMSLQFEQNNGTWRH